MEAELSRCVVIYPQLLLNSRLQDVVVRRSDELLTSERPRRSLQALEETPAAVLGSFGEHLMRLFVPVEHDLGVVFIVCP